MSAHPHPLGILHGELEYAKKKADRARLLCQEDEFHSWRRKIAELERQQFEIEHDSDAVMSTRWFRRLEEKDKRRRHPRLNDGLDDLRQRVENFKL